MALTTSVLLRIDDAEPAPGSGVRAVALSDATLLHTEVPFSAEPAELMQTLEAALGNALFEHDDPRGVFCIPSGAEPSRDAYLDVLDEVGEGGQWVPLPGAVEADGHGVPDGMGALSAVLSSVVQHMPEAMVEAASAAASGDLTAVRGVADQVASLMGAPVQAQGLEDLVRRMGGGELDLTSPAFQKLLEAVESQLAQNPAMVAQLRAQFFGAGTGGQGAGGDDGDA